MFDTEGFSVDLVVGGRWWWGAGVAHTFFLQVQRRRCWGTCEETTPTWQWHATRRHHGLVNPWAGSWSTAAHAVLVVLAWHLVAKEYPGKIHLTLAAPKEPPQPQERPWATALLRTAPGLKCSVSDVRSGKTIKGWIWELDLYAPCFLNSTDPLKIHPCSFWRLGHPI